MALYGQTLLNVFLMQRYWILLMVLIKREKKSRESFVFSFKTMC